MASSAAAAMLMRRQAQGRATRAVAADDRRERLQYEGDDDAGSELADTDDDRDYRGKEDRSSVEDDEEGG
eukprot:CAMPEP_0183817660 /NCGR_PEP_ID=MMETSP0803_2-20130417/60759_1 /TAXON_ID=195967 /ORGANISM="Crustomastix stigmata, Strain CCMP3273" /LENGTH=69 /DNA_ID=CAMNT_0026062545 /DNA_START=95 /DNA_END=300 /DNA_ORIENTATION=-